MKTYRNDMSFSWILDGVSMCLPRFFFFDAGFKVAALHPPKRPGSDPMSPSSDHKPSGQKGPQENWKKIACQVVSVKNSILEPFKKLT